MAKTVSQLKDSVAGILQGRSLDNVTNLNGSIERSARTLSARAYVPEASGRQSVMVYADVYDYAAPATIFGGSLTDFRPQGITRLPNDYVYKQPIELFDRTKLTLPNGVSMTFEYSKGTPIMRVKSTRTTPSITLDPMSATTGWSAGGAASTPVVDATVYYDAPGSLRFTLTGAAATGYLEKTLTSNLDLTDYNGVGVVFLALYTPSAANLSSVTLRLGSSSANYASVTATQGFLGAWPAGEFVLVAFDLSTAVNTGTPDFDDINYIRVGFTTAATLTNIRIGGLFVALPTPYELLFQSAAIFNASGVLSNTITSDNDTIILNDEAYTIFEYECAATIALQSGGTLSSGVVQMIDRVLNGVRAPRTGALIELGLYDIYRSKHPNEELSVVGNYYMDDNIR